MRCQFPSGVTAVALPHHSRSRTPLGADHGDCSVVVSAHKVVTLVAASSILPRHPKLREHTRMPRIVRDLEAERESSKRHYEANKDYYAARNTKRRKENQAYIRSLREGKCADCGGVYPWYVMEFDHCRGEKKYNIASMASSHRNTIDKEVAKCDLVCCNCHAVRTHERRAVSQSAEDHA